MLIKHQQYLTCTLHFDFNITEFHIQIMVAVEQQMIA